MRVAAHERERLARRHVEVAGHLVQAEAAVHAARVWRVVGVLPPAGRKEVVRKARGICICNKISCQPKKAIAMAHPKIG